MEGTTGIFGCDKTHADWPTLRDNAREKKTTTLAQVYTLPIRRVVFTTYPHSSDCTLHNDLSSASLSILTPWGTNQTAKRLPPLPPPHSQSVHDVKSPNPSVDVKQVHKHIDQQKQALSSQNLSKANLRT